MGNKAQTPPDTAGEELGYDRGQLAFIAVGLSVVLGGLWLLYSAEGPYHPQDASQLQLPVD